MSRLDCERWASLFDRQVASDPLSSDESAQQTQHVRACPACAQELAAWHELRAMDPALGPTMDRDRALEDIVLKKLWNGNEKARPNRTTLLPRTRGPRQSLGFAAALMAAALCVALVLWSRRKPGPASTEAQAHVTVGSGVAEVSGSPARRLGEPIKLGEIVSATSGPVCLLIEPGINACLAAGGELQVADTDLAHRRMHLNRGRLVASLTPQPKGSTFSISTRAGEVTAVGTVFAVEVPADGDPVLVRVHHGSVLVRTDGGQEQILHVHEAIALGTKIARDLPLEDEQRDRALLTGETVSVAPPAPGSSAAATVDPSPATLPREPAAAQPSVSSDPVIGPAGLLRQAVELRSRSQFSEAAQVYRRLQSLYPTSPEGRAGLVSLGDIQLSRLHDPRAALKTFGAYLASGDRTLEQEAQYGRIRALRAVGRDQEERAAIQQMLETHPSGMYSEPMRARLQALGGDGGL